jgi:uncharacterized protein
VVFAAGSTVALREIWQGRAWKGRPAIVVRDEPELVALWTPAGTPMLIADTGSGIPAADWRLVPYTAEPDALRLWRPGTQLMHVARWEDGATDGWKVDVIRPLRRFAAGFDYLDLELDVSVDRAGRVAIVDQDEFLEACRRGVIDEREATAVRREAGAALQAARRNAWPFVEGWERWRPDSAWPIPTLPEGWDASARDIPPIR